jgi:hypothetical protein
MDHGNESQSKKRKVDQLSDESLIALIRAGSDEIETYRRRQITTFREFIIVQALITWGIGRLGPTPGPVTQWTRGMGALVCLIAGIAGFWMIMLYKRRIHHIRDQRDHVTKVLAGSEIPLYYPTARPERGWFARLFSLPTSTIYGVTLIIVGVLTCLTNLIIGGVFDCRLVGQAWRSLLDIIFVNYSFGHG